MVVKGSRHRQTTAAFWDLTQEGKFLPFRQSSTGFCPWSVLFCIWNRLKMKVREKFMLGRPNACPSQNDFTVTKSAVPTCTRLNSYWAGYQLLVPHNYINKLHYPKLLLTSVFQFDSENSNKSIEAHLMRRTQNQQFLPFSRSFLPSTRWIPSLLLFSIWKRAQK